MKKTKQIQVKFDQEELVLKHINFFTKEQLEDIESMYMLTLYISLTSSIDELKIILKDHENDELYEKCEGIKRAIQFVEGSTRQEVLQEMHR